MRIDLYDHMGINHIIESTNPQTVAAWLGEWAEKALSSNAALPAWRMQVWPMSNEETEHGLQSIQNRQFTSEGLEALANEIRAMAQSYKRTETRVNDE